MGDCITDRQAKNISRIPSDTDVLITHSPAYGILDFDDGINYGDEQILSKVMEIHPCLHLFGHIHAQHGIISECGITFSNGAIMNADYMNSNQLNLIEIQPKNFLSHKRDCIPFPDKIKEIRTSYGLNYSQITRILGFGTNQYANVVFRIGGKIFCCLALVLGNVVPTIPDSVAKDLIDRAYAYKRLFSQ